MSSADRPGAWPPRRIVWFLAATLGAAAIFGAGFGVAGHHTAAMDHQAMIDTRSAEVMPFDLNKTTHVFLKTEDGGIESVVANDALDQQQVGLIRSHLQDEADKFRQGDYADPARIHGMDMPGLKDLEAGYRLVQVAYTDLPDGGSITYAGGDPSLVDALHAWFDRQLIDHGAHASAG